MLQRDQLIMITVLLMALYMAGWRMLCIHVYSTVFPTHNHATSMVRDEPHQIASTTPNHPVPRDTVYPLPTHRGTIKTGCRNHKPC